MEVLRVQTTFTSSNVVSPPDATAGFSYEGYIAIGDVRFSSFGDCTTRHSSATWKITRKSQRHCVWTSMEHQCRRRYSANTMHSFEALFKVQLTEFVFKCNKGYTVPQCKDVFVQRNSSRKNRRNDDTILPRTKRNFIRNSKQYIGAIAWNSLSSKESTAKNLKELKLLLTKFDIGKINSGFVVIFCKLCKCSLIS